VRVIGGRGNHSTVQFPYIVVSENGTVAYSCHETLDLAEHAVEFKHRIEYPNKEFTIDYCPTTGRYCEITCPKPNLYTVPTITE